MASIKNVKHEDYKREIVAGQKEQSGQSVIVTQRDGKQETEVQKGVK